MTYETAHSLAEKVSNREVGNLLKDMFYSADAKSYSNGREVRDSSRLNVHRRNKVISEAQISLGNKISELSAKDSQNARKALDSFYKDLGNASWYQNALCSEDNFDLTKKNSFAISAESNLAYKTEVLDKNLELQASFQEEVAITDEAKLLATSPFVEINGRYNLKAELSKKSPSVEEPAGYYLNYNFSEEDNSRESVRPLEGRLRRPGFVSRAKSYVAGTLAALTILGNFTPAYGGIFPWGKDKEKPVATRNSREYTPGGLRLTKEMMAIDAKLEIERNSREYTPGGFPLTGKMIVADANKRRNLSTKERLQEDKRILEERANSPKYKNDSRIQESYRKIVKKYDPVMAKVEPKSVDNNLGYTKEKKLADRAKIANSAKLTNRIARKIEQARYEVRKSDDEAAQKKQEMYSREREVAYAIKTAKIKEEERTRLTTLVNSADVKTGENVSGLEKKVDGEKSRASYRKRVTKYDSAMSRAEQKLVDNSLGYTKEIKEKTIGQDSRKKENSSWQYAGGHKGRTYSYFNSDSQKYEGLSLNGALNNPTRLEANRKLAEQEKRWDTNVILVSGKLKGLDVVQLVRLEGVDGKFYYKDGKVWEQKLFRDEEVKDLDIASLVKLFEDNYQETKKVLFGTHPLRTTI